MIKIELHRTSNQGESSNFMGRIRAFIRNLNSHQKPVPEEIKQKLQLYKNEVSWAVLSHDESDIVIAAGDGAAMLKDSEDFDVWKNNFRGWYSFEMLSKHTMPKFF
ncbi:hypothetical protein PanWU01x14_117470 [Parasponia andersonii]|uniref:Uncharacterized protein n=1 Tax=Parasponia andersonii TaxID=3476 RepID=A0A2P5CWL4_PARAD|nr:hypothetical protein PanWU01x14_117470 [Parasponia andersonii]